MTQQEIQERINSLSYAERIEISAIWIQQNGLNHNNKERWQWLYNHLIEVFNKSRIEAKKESGKGELFYQRKGIEVVMELLFPAPVLELEKPEERFLVYFDQIRHCHRLDMVPEPIARFAELEEALQCLKDNIANHENPIWGSVYDRLTDLYPYEIGYKDYDNTIYEDK